MGNKRVLYTTSGSPEIGARSAWGGLGRRVAWVPRARNNASMLALRVLTACLELKTHSANYSLLISAQTQTSLSNITRVSGKNKTRELPTSRCSRKFDAKNCASEVVPASKQPPGPRTHNTSGR